MRWNSINYNFKLLSLGWMDNFNVCIHHSLHLCSHRLYTFDSISIYRNTKTTNDNICLHKLIHHLINFVAMNKQIWKTTKNRSNYDEAAKMIVYCIDERFIQHWIQRECKVNATEGGRDKKSATNTFYWQSIDKYHCNHMLLPVA